MFSGQFIDLAIILTDSLGGTANTKQSLFCMAISHVLCVGVFKIVLSLLTSASPGAGQYKCICFLYTSHSLSDIVTINTNFSSCFSTG